MITIKRKPNFKPQLYEKEAWTQNKLICGIDEVGRSCLAGPVVAAAVILKPYSKYRYIKDSKVLTEQERLKAYNWLLKNSEFSVGIINHRLIDKFNIHYATIYAMKRALLQLLLSTNITPEYILVDHMALKFENIDIPVVHFCYGEKLSSSIAAASIIAKVTRDSLMNRYDQFLPGYKFFSNKGYGTREHKMAINSDGLLICHRNSFTNKYILNI